ncbi:MAG: MFS transporter, partial [Anaerolineaceae bacterium]|nr:MFS transporter [Anaerolineaceae bacterium]
NIASFMYIPLLPVYLQELDASVLQVGLFFTLSQILPLVLQIVGGWISDTMGRLRSVALGSVGGVFAYVAIVLAPSWQWLLLGEAFGAVARSLVAPSFGAYVAEQSTEENRARVYGISEAVFMVVMVVGPPLGGFFAEKYGFKFMLSVATLIYSTATVIRIMMARSAANTQSSKTNPLTFSGLRTSISAMLGFILAGGLITWLLITDGMRDIAYTMSLTFMPIYLENSAGLSVQQIGWLTSVFGAGTMLATFPAGWLADKKGERLTISLGFLFNFLAMIVFIQAVNYYGYILAWAVFGLGVGMLSPAFQSLISKAIPDKLRGTAFGMLQTSLGIFSLPAPAIGAQIWERWSPRALFMLTGWITLFAIIPVWLKFKTPANGGEPPSVMASVRTET